MDAASHRIAVAWVKAIKTPAANDAEWVKAAQKSWAKWCEMHERTTEIKP